MAVTLPTHLVQQMDRDAESWMNETRALLNRGEYAGLKKKIQS